jgi:hypothetical protein
MVAPIVVLGPQRLQPTLRDAVAELGGFEPAGAHYAVVTAGWEERESEDRELVQHLGGRVTNLQLFQRAERVFRADPALLQALLRRHDRQQKLQELYRLRLGHALDAARALLYRSSPEDDRELVEIELRSAIEEVRLLDAFHVQRVRELSSAFEEEWHVLERDAVARERGELVRILTDASAVCVAGGHVGVLLSRLRLFGFGALLRSQPLFCWSAGAMALSERVVTFHDSPPEGAGKAEVLEAGLGVIRGIVPLPHARRRLALADPLRVSLFARRFGPAHCVALDERTRVHWDGRRWHGLAGTRELLPDGRLAEVGA